MPVKNVEKNPEDVKNYHFNRGRAAGIAYPVFQHKFWKWARADGDFNVPTLGDIENLLTDLEISALENVSSACGRLRVEYNKELNEFEYLLEL